MIVSEAVWVSGLSVIHKPRCLKGNIREITRATGVSTPLELLMWKCKDSFIGQCQANYHISFILQGNCVFSYQTFHNKEGKLKFLKVFFYDGGEELFPRQISACVNSLKNIKEL